MSPFLEKRMKQNECVFCKIVSGEVNSKKVAESSNLIAILDAKPKTEGHTLIIPKRHYVNILDFPNKLGLELVQMIKKVSSNLMDEKKAEGFNVVMNNFSSAGQVVMHAHIHIIPRREGDGIRL